MRPRRNDGVCQQFGHLCCELKLMEILLILWNFKFRAMNRVGANDLRDAELVRKMTQISAGTRELWWVGRKELMAVEVVNRLNRKHMSGFLSVLRESYLWD